MAIIVSVHSFRGGTGKSNTTANISAVLASQGKRVGVIDGDIQSPGIHTLFGLAGDDVTATLNDFLWHGRAIRDVALDVTDRQPVALPGRIFLIPSSMQPGEITRVLREGYDARRLTEGIRALVNELSLDVLVLDTHPGLNEETLLSLVISDALLIIMRPDRQDYEGTGITARVAKELAVPHVQIMVNKAPVSLDHAQIARQVEAAYGCPVVAVLPHSDELMLLASEGLFVLRNPDHATHRALPPRSQHDRPAGVSSGFSLSREELLGGMPARRASTIVFAIENLTLQLVARSRRALVRYQPAESARDRERQFIDAVGGGREAAVHPTIQDLERYATDWAPMVPDVPDVQAAVLHQLATRYPLVRERCPRISAALAADTPAVADAYRRQQSREVEQAFTPTIGWRQRLRWWRARVSERVETMPPFWMAFSLTLTETVGGGMLAIPIALAGVGVPIGLALLVVFAVISITTIAALVEGITRDGSMRYGNGYFGQLVENRLGRPGGVAIGVSMFALNAVGLMVALIGFGTVLAGQTGVPALLWVLLLFAAIVIVLRRESLDATIAAALLVGIAVLALAGGMIALGLLHVQPELLAGPSTGAGSGTSVVALIFGVLLYVYFGHTSAGNAARQVLRRDPSGRTLVWGNVAAMVVAAVIYSLFVIAVNGSVPASRLASETGTAVAPLAEVAGPLVGVFGSIYVILSLGLGAVFMSLGLFLQTIELSSPRATLAGWVRFGVGAVPVVVIFALTGIVVFLGAVSFTGPLALVGALILPLLGGVFPMLIIAAARRRGERVPGTRLRWLGNPVVVAAVIALYLGGIVVQGLFIWTNPLERILALLVAVGMAALIVVSVRRHSFAPRTVVELLADEPPGAGMTVAVVADGKPVPAVVQLARAEGPAVALADRRIADLAGVSSISVDLPSGAPRELEVWAHQPTRDGDSHALAVDTDVRSIDDGREVTVRPTRAWLADQT